MTYNPDLCQYCQRRPRRKRSACCSAECEEKRRAHNKQASARKREAWRSKTRGRPSFFPPTCPVCGAEISATMDCQCPQEGA